MKIRRHACVMPAKTFLIFAMTLVATSNFGKQSQILWAAESDQELLKDAQSTFAALPKQSPSAKPELVVLGRKLFFDPRISDDGTVSCMRCHQAALYATDGLAKSHGAHDNHLPRNAPTVFNTGLYFREHWRGEFESVEEQAKNALVGPGFANPDFATAMAHVKAIPGYAELFKQAFPKDADPITPDNWGKAIGAFERTLTTPSPFDELLSGKPDALSADERKGLRIFMDSGCSNCHNGVGIGGTEYEKFGVVADYWKETHSQEVDKGRFDLTKNSGDLYVFKVPGLRNVAMTPPYFHDGSVADLQDAVRIMSKVQLGKTLSDGDSLSIVAFLQSLTGTIPDDYANAPLLPPASFRAPRTTTGEDNVK